MRLLVSVVSAGEARRALAGGADIIDVKDPRQGALGAPSPRVVSEVVEVVGASAPISVALGDEPSLPLITADYVKVGLRRVNELGDAVELVSAVADAVGRRTSVIAVAYADAAALDPPALSPASLPELVGLTGIAGALVDTFVKDGRGLYAWVTESELGDLIVRTHTLGASFGVAGQLTREDLCRVPADVVGVRSAVCGGGDRAGELDAELVAAAIAELRAHAGVMRVPTPPRPGLRTTTVTPVRRTASGK